MHALWPHSIMLCSIYQYTAWFLTVAENSSILGVITVVIVEALVRAVDEHLLCTAALHVVQENGSITLAVESPRHSKCSYKYIQ